MKLDRRTAGGLAAAGAALFVLATFGVVHLRGLLELVLDIDVPYGLSHCCGCFGIVMVVAPLALLSFTLFRKAEHESRESPPP